MTLELFQTLADAYGANFDRWPDNHRSAAVQFFASHPRARALIAEARALDRLLDIEPSVRDGITAGLACRIVEAATSQPAGRPSRPRENVPTVVVNLTQRQTRPAATKDLIEYAPQSVPEIPPARRIARYWPAAAALAASLAFGITIGVHDLTHAPVRGLVAMASAGSDADVDQFVAALHADGIATATDEERQ